MVKSFDSVLLETRKLYEAMSRFDNSAAGELGVHASDIRCINALENGPLSAGEIGYRLGLTSGSVTALINRLESAGFIERHKSPEDARILEIQLRNQFYARADAIYNRLGERLSEAFAEDPIVQRRVATLAIRKITKGFDKAS